MADNAERHHKTNKSCCISHYLKHEHGNNGGLLQTQHMRCPRVPLEIMWITLCHSQQSCCSSCGYRRTLSGVSSAQSSKACCQYRSQLTCRDCIMRRSNTPNTSTLGPEIADPVQLSIELCGIAIHVQHTVGMQCDPVHGAEPADLCVPLKIWLLLERQVAWHCKPQPLDHTAAAVGGLNSSCTS